jgi:hypothetical protein
MKRVCGPAALLLSLVLAVPARASVPTGIYVLVEEVILEPNETSPERILIKGVFMNEIDNGRESPDSQLRQPKRGWMAFKLARGKEDLCRLEWKDLKSVKKGSVVAFGSVDSPFLNEGYYVNNAVKEQQPTGEPNLAYPIGHGMYLLRPDSPPARTLQKKQQEQK